MNLKKLKKFYEKSNFLEVRKPQMNLVRILTVRDSIKKRIKIEEVIALQYE